MSMCHGLYLGVVQTRAMPSNQPQPVEPILLRTREVAALTGVSPRTVEYWRERGVLEPVRIGGVTRYRRSDVEALAKSPKNKERPG